jgi:hypothetical protein
VSSTPTPISASGNDTSYWVYWGNASPPQAQNDPGAVFEFYDNFDSRTALGAAWAQNGAVAITNGMAVLGQGESMRLLTDYSPSIAADFQLVMPTYDFRWWAGFQVSGSFADDAPWALWISRGTPADTRPEYTAASSPAEFIGAVQQPPGAAPGHLYGIDLAGTHATYRLEDVVKDSCDGGTLPTSINVRFTNECGNSTQLFVDMVRVRQTVHPYPTVTRGPIQP